MNLKIASAPHDTHGDHLDDHFPKKVEVDHVIDYLGIVIQIVKTKGNLQFTDLLPHRIQLRWAKIPHYA